MQAYLLAHSYHTYTTLAEHVEVKSQFSGTSNNPQPPLPLPLPMMISELVVGILLLCEEAALKPAHTRCDTGSQFKRLEGGRLRCDTCSHISILPSV